MKPLPELEDSKKIYILIIRFMNQFEPESQFKTYSVVRFVNQYANCKRKSDSTILKYLRRLRAKGHFNYTYIGSKSAGEIKILEMGKPHSI